VPFDGLAGRGEQLAVALAVGTDEHAGAAAAEARGHDPGAFEGFPGDFEQQALLRVHGEGLARGHAEEPGVEPVRCLDEPAAPRVDVAQADRAAVHPGQQRRPAAVGRQRPDRVGARRDQVPQLPGRLDPAGEAAADADDRDRLRGGVLHLAHAPARPVQVGGDALEVVTQLALASHPGLSVSSGRDSRHRGPGSASRESIASGARKPLVFARFARPGTSVGRSARAAECR
jgi:hypothetical protein